MDAKSKGGLRYLNRKRNIPEKASTLLALITINDMRKRKFRAVVAYGERAGEIISLHEGEKHTAEEWKELISRELCYNENSYNPIEILSFASQDEREIAMLDPGSGMIPKYWIAESE